jgi:hypothetical protein
VLTDFDIAYFEDYYRQRPGTAIALGEPRYMPPDVAVAGDGIADKLRRSSNDLYALAVLTLDLFTGQQLSLDTTRAEIGRAIAVTNRQDSDPWFRKRLTNFLHKAIQSSEKARFHTINQYQREWDVVTTKGRSASWVIGVTELVLVLALATLTDWAWHASRGLQSIATSALFGGGALAMVLTLLSHARSMMRPYASRVQQKLLLVFSEHPGVATVGAILISVGSIAWALETDPVERATSARLTLGVDCIALDHQANGIIPLGRSDNPTFSTLGVSAILCAQAGGEAASVSGLSLVTPLPPLSVLPEQQVGVQIIEVVGNSVRYAIGSAVRTSQLRGIQETDGATIAASLTLAPLGIQLPVQGVLVFGFPAQRVDVLFGKYDLGLELLRQGYARADRAYGALPSHDAAEDEARTARFGVWKIPLVPANDLEVGCPKLCCPEGRACTEIEDCLERFQCDVCQNSGVDLIWDARLVGLEFPSSKKWKDVKVCLTTRGNGCGQVCVRPDNIGTDLGLFRCPYHAGDFGWTLVEVVGTKVDGTDEVRIAEKQLGFSNLGQDAYCSGLRTFQLDEKKGQVMDVKLTIGIRDQPDSAYDSQKSVRLVVNRGETLVRGHRSYYFEVGGSEKVRGHVNQVDLDVLDTKARNAEVWRSCPGQSGTASSVTPISSGLCDRAALTDGCTCKFVLESKHCTKRNELTVEYVDGTSVTQYVDACAAIDEHDGKLGRIGREIELRHTDKGLKFIPIGEPRLMSCGLTCKPTFASIK